MIKKETIGTTDNIIKILNNFHIYINLLICDRSSFSSSICNQSNIIKVNEEKVIECFAWQKYNEYW